MFPLTSLCVAFTFYLSGVKLSRNWCACPRERWLLLFSCPFFHRFHVLYPSLVIHILICICMRYYAIIWGCRFSLKAVLLFELSTVHRGHGPVPGTKRDVHVPSVILQLNSVMMDPWNRILFYPVSSGHLPRNLLSRFYVSYISL